MKFLFVDLNLILVMAGVAVAAMVMIGYAFFRPAETPEAIERKRRLHLNQIGRITEGQVVELAEHPPGAACRTEGTVSFATPVRSPQISMRHLVSYSYAISGVTYHTAQDITGLEGQIRFERLVAGQPASVKYDPSNPSRLHSRRRRLVRPALTETRRLLLTGPLLVSSHRLNPLDLRYSCARDFCPAPIRMKMIFASIFTTVLIVAMSLGAMFILVQATVYVTAIASPLQRTAAIGAELFSA